MPNLEQLPEATAANPTDLIMLAQSGTSSSVTVETLLTGLQPQLTLAQSTLLGRVSVTPGAPEPVAIGPGVKLTEGVLAADTSIIAPLASPAFTGTPTAPTPAVGDASNAVATTAFVQTKYFQPLTLAGDITGTASPTNSGTVNVSLPAITTPGTFTKVAVNAKGQVISGGTTLSPSDIAGFEAAVPVQSVAGQIGAVTDLSAGTVIPAQATTARTLASRLGEQLNVLDYGADPSGATNSEPAFAAAQLVGQVRGGAVINIPPGTYDLASTVYTVSGNTWVIGPNVTFTGSGGMEALTDNVTNVGMTFGKFSADPTGASTVFISQFAGESGATASYEKNGLYVRVETGDPSSSTNNLDMVGAELQAQIRSGNTSGRAWAADFITTVDAGADGYAVGLELAVENFGVYQPLIDQSNSKLGISLFASGTINSTIALGIHSAGAEWVDGILIKDTAVQNNAFRVVTNSGSSWVDTAHIDRSGNILGQGLVVENAATFNSTVAIGGSLSAGAVATGYTALSPNAGGLIQIGAPATASGTPTLQFWGSSITSEPSVQVINDTTGHLTIINSTGSGANIAVGAVTASGVLSVNDNGTVPANAGAANGGAGLALTWNATGGQAESDFIAYRTPAETGGFVWWDYPIGGTIAPIATLAPSGAMTLNAVSIHGNGIASAYNSIWTSGNPGNGAFQWSYTGAVPSAGVIGPLTTIYNNGPHCAQGAKYTYFSTAGAADSVDNAQTQIAIFNPTGMSGINIGDELVRWTVGITPQDTSHNWTHVVEEYNVVNRGLDIGWKAYRNDPVNNITGPQQITGIVNYSPEATGLGQPGEGKNLLFAELFGQSEATNSTGLPARFYNASLYEPNCVVGGTGRAIYINGDVTGLTPQIPYAPLEVSLTWLHGLRTTSATFTDGAALTMASGQQVAWTNATSTASITASGSGANQSITLTPAGTGSVTISKLQASGGTLDNTPIGATTASTGAFTTLKSTTLTAATSAGVAIGTAMGTVLAVTDNGTSALSKLVVTPGNGGQPPVIAVSGETNQGLVFRGAGNGQINFQSGSGGSTNSLTILPNATAVNALSITGGSTGQNVVLGVNGSDTNVTIQLVPQGTGTVYINKLQGAGGSIDNTPIGASTPSTAAVTTLKSTGLASFAAGIADASFSSQTPTTGFAITVANGVSTLQLTPAGTLASGTITMPSAPGNGQWLLVTSTAAVTACSFTPASGQTLLGAPTTLPAFVEMAFQYQTSANRWVCQSGNDTRVASVFTAAALMFGTGADGAVAISSGTTTLTRDMHYTNLTLSGTGVLNPAGWRVFVNGTLDVSAAPVGAIISNGNAANNASGSTAGAAPGGLSLRTVGQSPTTGGNGGNGSTTTGTAGTAGASITYGNGGNGGAAGSGGTATSAGGAAGNGGSQTVQIQLNTPTLTFWCPADNAGLACGLIGGGGGGGGGDATNAGGGGGSGGSFGGTIALYARNIQRGTNATASIIQAKGSNGGTGANGVAGNAAGGGGGGGGGGGLIYIITEALLGSAITNALDVSGGIGGTGGTGSGTGKGGNGGTGGAGGSVQILNLLTPAFTGSAWNTAGTTGATTSTSTAATGGAGATVRTTL